MSLFGWSYPAGCSGPPDVDAPEECPECGKPNYDEDTDKPVYAADPVFCSETCCTAYTVRAKELAESDAKGAAEALAFDLTDFDLRDLV